MVLVLTEVVKRYTRADFTLMNVACMIKITGLVLILVNPIPSLPCMLKVTKRWEAEMKKCAGVTQNRLMPGLVNWRSLEAASNPAVNMEWAGNDKDIVVSRCLYDFVVQQAIACLLHFS